MSIADPDGQPFRVVHLDLERGWRGGERQVWLLLRHLPDAARRDDLAIPGQLLVCRRGEPLEERAAELPGVEVVPVRNRLAAMFRLPWDDGATVLHAHTGNTVPLAVLGLGRHQRSVVTRRLDYRVSGFLFRRVDAVVAISGRVHDVLVDVGVQEERLRIIPDGIDLSRDGPDDVGRLRRQLGLDPGVRLGLTVAALVDQKDPLTLVRALPDLPADYRHLWLGEGPLRRRSLALASELGVADRFHAPGFDPEPDRWFAAADVFVLPSRAEGLGTVLLDAFHFGVPVAASRIPATAGLLEDRISALLFERGDSLGLATAVEELLGAPGLARSLTEEGARRVRDYDAREVARSYLRLYRDLLNAAP